MRRATVPVVKIYFRPFPLLFSAGDPWAGAANAPLARRPEMLLLFFFHFQFSCDTEIHRFQGPLAE